LKLANDSWWFRFKELKSRGQQGGILSHAKVEPNVESTLDNLLASILSASGDSVTIVDVGANIGQTLVRLHAAWVGKGKVPRIISVEPGKTAFAKLQQAAKKFQAHLNLELVNAAVLNATGKILFLRQQARREPERPPGLGRPAGVLCEPEQSRIGESVHAGDPHGGKAYLQGGLPQGEILVCSVYLPALFLSVCLPCSRLSVSLPACLPVLFCSVP